MFKDIKSSAGFVPAVNLGSSGGSSAGSSKLSTPSVFPKPVSVSVDWSPARVELKPHVSSVTPVASHAFDLTSPPTLSGSGSGAPPKIPTFGSTVFADPEPPRKSGAGLFSNAHRNQETSAHRSERFTHQSKPERDVVEPHFEMKVAVAAAGGSSPGDGGNDTNTCGRCKGAGELDLHAFNPGKGLLLSDHSAVYFFEKKARTTLPAFSNHFGVSFESNLSFEASSHDKQICRNCDGSGNNNGPFN